MTVQASYQAELTVSETLSDADAQIPIITHQAFNTSYNLNGTSTPPASEYGSLSTPMTSGALSIDLTALTGANGASVNGTGLAVRAFRLLNPETNAAALTFQAAGSNGYNLAGAGWKLVLNPGDDVLMYVGAAPRSAAARLIAVTGTGTDTVQAGFVIG